MRAFVDDEAIAVAFTDRDGGYALEVPAESFELRLAKRGYTVARAGGPPPQSTAAAHRPETAAPGETRRIDLETIP